MVSTKFVSAVPIIPAQEIEASATWYRDKLAFEIVHTEHEYGIVGRDDLHAVRDADGNLVTFFERTPA